MSLRYNLLHPVETFRSAPFGLVFSGANSLLLPLEALAETSTPAEQTLRVGLLAFSGVAKVTSDILTVRQFKLKGRLEQSFEANGFNERILATTTDAWCNRQTARVVCEKYDALDQYTELCAPREDTAEFGWLPHI